MLSNKDDIFLIRIYTDKLVNEKPVESFADKVVRSKPAGGDITQIYTASIQAQKVSSAVILGAWHQKKSLAEN